MQIDISGLHQLASQASASTKKLFKKLKQRTPANLDQQVEQFHEEVFSYTDCLTCANCCKTTSPVFTSKDIERIARHLRLKPGQFIHQYLHIDEEGDYVLNTAPCPFLHADHTCQIYEQRPSACQQYPHTNRKKFHQILDLTVCNTYICPAAFQIVEKLKKLYT
ncbi:YkgJ family cysteine cluster protein [Rhodocytophaga rosea]|uniref:YkgJ family cysteine cluster protein n=1 Tax=Rhodocytophaga rosea TaxID=2704465 RepID=A0A6C0GST3_9BACT|nr:YkgJ family cysteine cluster protein [Rhodocytophaga rosea]QHT71199.1 YkgJ family cysteine cluster protein [Rhodocytophaga rosea]